MYYKTVKVFFVGKIKQQALYFNPWIEISYSNDEPYS